MSQYIGAIIDGQYNEDDISIVALGNMKCTVETVLAAAMQTSEAGNVSQNEETKEPKPSKNLA
jgi:hypothetical protein